MKEVKAWMDENGKFYKTEKECKEAEIYDKYLPMIAERLRTYDSLTSNAANLAAQEILRDSKLLELLNSYDDDMA